MHMITTLYRATLGAAFVAGANVCAAQAADQTLNETTPDILASQIRDQGFACNKAQDAHLDAKQSKPNETVWLLTCENDAYRMTLVPDMGARIEKLKK
jgi:hypothetical protein